MKINLTIDGRTFTAEFVKSEEAGYTAGRLLLDLPAGETISIYKRGSKWIEAHIDNGICRRSIEHKTRHSALNSAAEEFAGQTLHLESMGI